MLVQLKEVLKRLKWTEGQTSVYCTLVEKGAMKPADLVIHAGVAQGKIYSVLGELATNGAVIKLADSPTKYDAQNPRYVLNNILGDVEDMKEIALQQGAEEVYEKRYEQMVRETTCWVVQGISGVMIQLRSLASNCNTSLKISDPDLNWLGKSGYKMINKLIKEGKTVQVMGKSSFGDVLDDLGNKGAKVRTYEKLSSYYVIDDMIVLLRFTLPDCGVVIKDSAFANDKVKQFECDFEHGMGLEVDRIET